MPQHTMVYSHEGHNRDPIDGITRVSHVYQCPNCRQQACGSGMYAAPTIVIPDERCPEEWEWDRDKKCWVRTDRLVHWTV